MRDSTTHQPAGMIGERANREQTMQQLAMGAFRWLAICQQQLSMVLPMSLDSVSTDAILDDALASVEDVTAAINAMKAIL